MIVSILRKQARENLKGKWKKVILMMLVFFALTILLSYLKDWLVINTPYGLISNIINAVIVVALNYGILVSFIRIKRDEKINCFHFIYYAARDFEKVWKVIGRMLLRLLVYIISLLLLGYIIITEIVSLYLGNGIRLSFFVEIIAFIALTIFFCMKMLEYSVNNYILFDNKEDKAKNILNESKRLMKGHRWDFVRMYLSFSGWYILGLIFSVGIILLLYFYAKINTYYLLYISYIPLIFLMPYMYVTSSYFYDNLLYNNPKPKEEENNKNKTKKKKSKKKN